MSNPTTLVFPLTSSLDGTDQSGSVSLTGTDPIRYDGGLWLEEATTNYITNPSIETGITDWGTSVGGVIRSQDTTGAVVGTKSLKVINDGANASQGVQYIGGSPPASVQNDKWSMQAYLRGASGAESAFLGVSQRNAGGSGIGDVVGAPHALTTVPTLYKDTIVVSGATTASIRPKIVGPNSLTSETFFADSIQIEKKGYHTSYCDGSLGAGYAWTGTAHASTSTRAASSASIDPTGYLDPQTGSLAFRFTRKIDTGGTETLLECGTAGSGTDYLSISVNSSDKLVVSWNSDNAGAQTVTSTESIAVDTEYFVYTEWASGTMGLSIDNGDLVVGARDAVEGDWGVGELVLEAT